MQLRTYTSLWQVEKKIYSFYDWTLPFPLPVKVIVPFLTVGVPTWAICIALGIPFKPPFPYLAYIVPPCGAAYGATRHIAEGKKIQELIVSFGRFFLQARTYSRLRPWAGERKVGVFADLWHKNNPVLPVVAPELPSEFDQHAHTVSSVRQSA